MAEKIIKTRIQHKIDTTTNWNKATNFVPKNGELIFYSDTNQMKIGDGVSLLSNLSFAYDIGPHMSAEVSDENLTITGGTIGSNIVATGSDITALWENSATS